MTDYSRNRRMAVYDTSFRTTLRQMAEADDAADRRRLYDLLASQIEVALNNQANMTQVVLWDVQEAAYKKIDALHEHQADTNLLLTGVMDSLAGIQASVQQVLAAHKETARGLKKLEAQMSLIVPRIDEHERRLDRKAARLDAHDTRLTDLEQRVRRLEERGDGER